MEYMASKMDDQIEAAQRAEWEADREAIAWAYGRCIAFGLENSTMENAMMMDRLKAIIS